MPKVYGSARKREDAQYPSSLLQRHSSSRPVSAMDKPTQNNLQGPAQLTLDGFVLKASTSANVVENDKPGPSKRRVKFRKYETPSWFQLHLTQRPLLRTCPACHMSFVEGGAQDEAAHSRHHRNVVAGIPWDSGRGLTRPGKAAGYDVGGTHVTTTKGLRGRLFCLNASDAGQRLFEVLRMIDTVLSAPALSTSVLQHCKVFLFVTDDGPSDSCHGRIAGACVAQKIRWAMRIRETDENTGGDEENAVECDPTPVHAILGIHRLFTLPILRCRGIAEELLNAACRQTVYGCEVTPTSGTVAFSQPTRSGKAVMDRWGKGSIRVFIDDDSQADA